MIVTKKQFWVIEVTRKDGSTFLASTEGGSGAAHFYDRKRCTAFKRELSQHIPIRQMKTIKATITIEV